MAEIITGIDFKSKDRSHVKVSEGSIDLAAIEREIALALGAIEFGGMVMICEPFYDPKEPA